MKSQLVFSIYLKLESLTRFSAPNWIIWLTEHPPQHILSISVVLYMSWNLLSGQGLIIAAFIER